MATTYQEFETRLDVLQRSIEALNRDCQQRKNLTAERAHQCYLWAESKWIDAFLADDKEGEASWDRIARDLAQTIQSLNS